MNLWVFLILTLSLSGVIIDAERRSDDGEKRKLSTRSALKKEVHRQYGAARVSRGTKAQHHGNHQHLSDDGYRNSSSSSSSIDEPMEPEKRKSVTKSKEKGEKGRRYHRRQDVVKGPAAAHNLHNEILQNNTGLQSKADGATATSKPLRSNKALARKLRSSATSTTTPAPKLVQEDRTSTEKSTGSHAGRKYHHKSGNHGQRHRSLPGNNQKGIDKGEEKEGSRNETTDGANNNKHQQLLKTKKRFSVPAGGHRKNKHNNNNKQQEEQQPKEQQQEPQPSQKHHQHRKHQQHVEKTMSNSTEKRSATCRYAKSAWSDCNPETNMRTRILTLKSGDSSCQPTRMMEKKCKNQCIYEKKAPWSPCQNGVMTRISKLKTANTGRHYSIGGGTLAGSNIKLKCEPFKKVTKKCEETPEEATTTTLSPNKNNSSKANKKSNQRSHNKVARRT